MGRPNDPSSGKEATANGDGLHRLFMGARGAGVWAALLLALSTAPALAQGPAGKDLRAFYQQNCASCHGPDGSGFSAEGKKLSGRDFTDQDWQRSAREDAMIKTILKGKFFGLAMPGYEGALTAEEARQMVAGIVRKARKGHMIAPGAGGDGAK